MSTIDMPLNRIKVGSDRVRRDFGDLDSLAKNIAKIGLLHPIVVTSDNVLVVGERRLKAAQRLGWSTIPARVLDFDSILAAERDENELRKDFTPFERVAIGRALKREIGERRGRPSGNSGQKTGILKGKETRAVVAAKVGFGSASTYERAKRVVKHGSPELIKAMDEGKISIAAAAKSLANPRKGQKPPRYDGPEQSAVMVNANAVRREDEKESARDPAVHNAQGEPSLTVDAVLEWIEQAPIADVGRVWTACDSRISGTTA